MIPRRSYRVVAGETTYSEDTPDEVITLLERLRESRERVVLVYGNARTGERWESATPERGRIGRSTGTSKVPLLVRTSRSFGGEAILDDRIVEIRESRGGRVLYKAPPPEPLVVVAHEALGLQ